MTLTETLTNERHILVVDDDTGLREQMSGYLREHGYVVHEAGDGVQMAAALEAQAVSLIVLDVMMPGEDGLSICRRLSKTPGASIIMVSALGEEVDRVLGLELGADDYLAKPCSPRELLARVKAVLRRRETPSGEGGLTFRFAGFTLNTARRQLRSGDGATIMLTTTQSDAPMSYGIYLYMQSIAGRGPGAALGVLAVIIVALGTYFSHRIISSRALQTAATARGAKLE